jgi:hypothetical protein
MYRTMKKTRIFFMALALASITFTSCVMEDLCQDCDVVTYNMDTGDEIDRVSAAEYCGDDLDEIKNQAAYVVGSDSTIYECD